MQVNTLHKSLDEEIVEITDQRIIAPFLLSVKRSGEIEIMMQPTYNQHLTPEITIEPIERGHIFIKLSL